MRVVEVENLRKVFGDTVAVDGISFGVGRGEIVALLGPNGAGKTTTIKSILNLIVPDSGRIVVAGRDVRPGDYWLYDFISGVLEGNRNIYWRLTVEQNIRFFAGLNGRKISKGEIDGILERFGLGEKRKTEARNLSRGMQQKLAIASVLARKTPILILDEPTLGLDVDTTYQLMEIVRSLREDMGRTIIVSSHNMRFVENTADRVIFINGGRIVAEGSVEQLKRMFSYETYMFRASGGNISPQGIFPDGKVERVGDEWRIYVSLNQSEIYDAVDALRSNGFLLKEIRLQEPDLESIYMRVMKEERSDETASGNGNA